MFKHGFSHIFGFIENIFWSSSGSSTKTLENGKRDREREKCWEMNAKKNCQEKAINTKQEERGGEDEGSAT